MAPRKSTSKSARASRAGEAPSETDVRDARRRTSRAADADAEQSHRHRPRHSSVPREPARERRASRPPEQPTASSSKVTLDMPPLDVPESITWDYDAAERQPLSLSNDDKERFITEIMKLAPYMVLDDIAEHARQTIYPTVSGVEQWAEQMAGKDDAMLREVERGAHSLETLIESQVDRAFDMFTAWSLRNIFKVPDGVEPVLPWHRDLDFDRAKFVMQLEGGEDALVKRLDELRAKVEVARVVQHRLKVAEAELDRKLAEASQRRAKVGFVRDAVAEAGLTPLPKNADAIVQALGGIHAQLGSLDVPRRQPGPAADGAWESGRQQYWSWAVGKALGEGEHEAAARLDVLEAATGKVGSGEDLETLALSAGHAAGH